MSYRVAACRNGAEEPFLQANWETLPEAVASFMELAELHDAAYVRRTVRLLLTLMLGDYYHNTFQMLSADEQTIISITKITVGIPTPNERQER